MKNPVICSISPFAAARPRSEPFHLLQISPRGTRNTIFLIVQCSYTAIFEFLLLSSFHCSVLTIFLVDGLEIKMVAGRCRATAGRRQKMRSGGTGEGRPHKGVLEISRRHFDLTIWVLLFQISHSYVSHWVFSELWGGGYESLRMEITIVEPKGLLFDPPLNHHTKVTWFTLHPGSVFLMENLALINDWVN